MFHKVAALIRRARPSRRAVSRRLEVEVLEGRLVPSGVTRVWTGGGDGVHWSDANNWSGPVDPTGLAGPQAGDRLVFKSVPFPSNVLNDLPAGIVFSSLTIDHGDSLHSWEIVGNEFGVGALTDNSPDEADFITAPLILSSSATIIKVTNPFATLGLNRFSGHTLAKTGLGDLALENPTATSSSLSGEFLINQGTLTAAAQGDLGDDRTPILVAATGTLQVIDAPVYNNPMILAGTLTGPGPCTWAGPIVLAGPTARIGIRDLTLTSMVSGNFPLTISSGEATLAGTNRSAGLKVLSGATVTTSSLAALGQGPVTLGGTLKLNGGDRSLFVPNSLTFASGGTLRSVSGVNAWTGNVSLGTGGPGFATNIDVPADELNISGVISGGGPATILTKSGEGTLTLRGTNTYLGNTTVQNGVLGVTVASALGATTQTNSTVTVDDGATLRLRPVAGATFAGHALCLNGFGFDDTGALDSARGSNTWPGQVTLENETAVSVAVGSMLQFKAGLSGGPDQAGSLDKFGPGELDLNGDVALAAGSTGPAYQGPTTIFEGTLKAATGSALGGGSGNYVSLGTNVLSGATLLFAPAAPAHVTKAPTKGNPNTLPENLTLDGGATLQLASGTTASGAISLAGTATVSVTGTGAISGVIAGIDGAGLNIAATATAGAAVGVLTLVADNTYNGPTTIQSGELILLGNQPDTTVIVQPGALFSTVTGAPTAAPTSPPGPPAVASVMFQFGASFVVPINLGLASYTYLTLQAGQPLLNGNLNVTVLAAPAGTAVKGRVYTLVQNAAGSEGVFSVNGQRLQEGDIFTVGTTRFQIEYHGGASGGASDADVTLTVQ
jgi:autotransporter-associated beta strand protein